MNLGANFENKKTNNDPCDKNKIPCIRVKEELQKKGTTNMLLNLGYF